MSLVVSGPVWRSLVAEEPTKLAVWKGDDVLAAWRDCDWETCGEPLCVRAAAAVAEEEEVPVWRRERIEARMGRVSRVEGEISGGRAVELGAWEVFVA
jgi:hypothetical protein